MIVRNEGRVIQRCLSSVKPFINYWVICDTGSTDDTLQIVEQTLAGIPGEIHRDHWVNFAHNRTLGMDRASGKADYHLLLDADMVLNAQAEFRHKLTSDAYAIRFTGINDYEVPRIVSDRHRWRYVGVTHEYVTADTAREYVQFPEITVTHFQDGASRPQKYERDIQLLSEALQTDSSNSRYVFYLAQSYRDVGNFSKAHDYYHQRAGMGGWDEEVWYSLYQVASLKEALGHPWPECLAAYLQAFQHRPTRLEPIYRIARFYRQHKQYNLALFFARMWLEIRYPTDSLFIERNVYEELLPREYAICCRELGLQPDPTDY